MASLDRLLRLANKTGDRLIVVDSMSEEAYAVLPLDEYESLIAGRELDSMFGPYDLDMDDEDELFDWHSTADVLDDLFDPQMRDDQMRIPTFPAETPFAEDMPPIAPVQEDAPPLPNYEDLPFDDLQPVPLSSEESMIWDEDEGEEPVFLEEPVE